MKWDKIERIVKKTEGQRDKERARECAQLAESLDR